MKKNWFDRGWDDYVYWQNNDKKLVAKINRLIKEIERTPFSGSGKPEPLRGELSGFWSRRITNEHRIVYRIKDDMLEIVSCKGHYEDL